ncbi:MAG: GlsB/YeaQ/YmgE family stress response membrane protein [Dehalococcoidia bacterium]|nr:GlsB/YeaQ/YmgE family stress response membrane protein [Dehalococcoidia bacterium]
MPWLITGLIIGWLASLIIHSTLGTLGNIGVGLAGSVIGGVVYTMVTRNTAGGPLSLTRIGVGVVGAVALLVVVRLLRGSPSRL